MASTKVSVFKKIASKVEFITTNYNRQNSELIDKTSSKTIGLLYALKKIKFEELK